MSFNEGAVLVSCAPFHVGFVDLFFEIVFSTLLRGGRGVFLSQLPGLRARPSPVPLFSPWAILKCKASILAASPLRLSCRSIIYFIRRTGRGEGGGGRDEVYRGRGNQGHRGGGHGKKLTSE